jgi:hypothetical protein
MKKKKVRDDKGKRKKIYSIGNGESDDFENVRVWA